MLGPFVHGSLQNMKISENTFDKRTTFLLIDTLVNAEYLWAVMALPGATRNTLMTSEAMRLKTLEGNWLENNHRIDFKLTATAGMFYTGKINSLLRMASLT